MNVTGIKTENCFSDSQTYEYRLPITVGAFIAYLDETWQVRRNEKLRRPVLMAEKDGIRIRGILAQNDLRVSYPDESWETRKSDFEKWMEQLDEF